MLRLLGSDNPLMPVQDLPNGAARAGQIVALLLELLVLVQKVLVKITSWLMLFVMVGVFKL